jgi:hypothetical protein
MAFQNWGFVVVVGICRPAFREADHLAKLFSLILQWIASLLSLCNPDDAACVWIVGLLVTLAFCLSVTAVLLEMTRSKGPLARESVATNGVGGSVE